MMNKQMYPIVMGLLIVGTIVSVEAAPGSKYFWKRAAPPQGKVTVYVNENYTGSSETYVLPKWVCVNVDPGFRGYISSIRPEPGTCVQVFRGLGCPEFEKPKELKEYTLGTDTLAKIDLNDQISSLKYCDP